MLAFEDDVPEAWDFHQPYATGTGSIFLPFFVARLDARHRKRNLIMKPIVTAFGLSALLVLAACTNPYDPGQRAVGGGLIGAGAGAAIGGLAGGGRGAAIGALSGGALGAATGALTTPTPPPRQFYQQPARKF